MRTLVEGGKKRVVIDPGEYFVTSEDLVISTLLGSCVSACLWDPVNRIVGMNHFLLAERNPSKGTPLMVSEAGRYGIHAMELLINSMIRKGATKNLIRAKAFGGGSVLAGSNQGDYRFNIGEMNSQFIIDFLDGENIPIDTYNLRGDYGRVIHFASIDYSVLMRRIGVTTEKVLVRQEKQYLKTELSKRENESQDSSSIFL